MSDAPEVVVYKEEDFRKWLKKNGNKEKRVAVILYKRHTGKHAPTHRELIEEAISYGWIDTTIKRLDEDRFIRYFAKRTDKSTWSDNTLSYARKLIKEGRMTPEGMKYFNLGKVKKTHDHGIPKNPDMPDEVKIALSKNKKAKKVFDTVPPSTKKNALSVVLKCKAPRDKRKESQTNYYCYAQGRQRCNWHKY